MYGSAMPVRTFENDIEPLPIREEISFSRIKCANHSLAIQYVQVFSDLLDEWQIIFVKYITLHDNVTQADSQVEACDDLLDVFVDDVAATVLLNNNNDRNSDEFRSYFGSKQPYEIRRPVLGDELELVRGWIVPLKASPNPIMNALGVRGDDLCKNADAAVIVAANAKQELRTFLLIGEYSQFIAKVNGTRKSIHGELGKAKHSQAGKNLPGDFADRFFKHETRRNKKLTLDGARKKVIELSADLARYQSRVTTLEAKEAQEQADELEQKALEQELAETDDAKAALEKRRAEIQAKLKKK